MEKFRQASILEDCLDRVAAGEPVAECLTAYGSQAAAVEPLIQAAARLQRLRMQSLNDAQRQKAHATLVAAMREHNRAAAGAKRPKLSFGWFRGWQRVPSLGSVAFAVVLALVLVVAMTFTAVASQPGDLMYPLRVTVERLPVMLANSAESRVSGELNLADRRLADVESFLRKTGQVTPVALTALLNGDERAASEARTLSPQEQAELHARVTAHARILAALAAEADEPQAGVVLQQAARVTNQIATRLAEGTNDSTRQKSPQEPPGPGPAGDPTDTPTAAPMHGPTAALRRPAMTPQPPTATPRHYAATAAPRGSGQGATGTYEPGRRETSQPRTPAVIHTPNPAGTVHGTTSATPEHSGTAAPAGFTPTPGQRATAHAVTAIAPGPHGTPAGEPPGEQGPSGSATSIPEVATPEAGPENAAPTDPAENGGGQPPGAGAPGPGGRR